MKKNFISLITSALIFNSLNAGNLIINDFNVTSNSNSTATIENNISSDYTKFIVELSPLQIYATDHTDATLQTFINSSHLMTQNGENTTFGLNYYLNSKFSLSAHYLMNDSENTNDSIDNDDVVSLNIKYKY
jgi:hypothetical protein